MIVSKQASSRFQLRASIACKSSLAISALVVGLTTAASSYAAGPYYPMICRGGGDLMMSISQLQDGRNTIELNFDKGTRAYRRETLMPGQCTWPDRGLSRGEPGRILHITVARVRMYMWASQFNTIGTPVNDPRTGWPVVLTRRFMELSRGTGVFTVWARNTNAGYFEISNARAGD